VRRRRECLTCKERFTTFETVEIRYPRIIKKNNSRVAYDPDKLMAGIMRALEKRPVSTEAVTESVRKIHRELLTCREPEVGTEMLGELVMQQLRSLDPVAFIRFASVYRKFDDVNEFIEEIARLQK